MATKPPLSLVSPLNDGASLFQDEITNLVDRSFQMGKSLNLIQQYVDGDTFTGSTFEIGGKVFHNFSVCSYLGLEIDPRVKAGIVDYAVRFGASFIMSRTYASASGFAEFEALLSDIFQAYPVVTPSTTLGHLSFVSVMVQKGDIIIVDQHAHNSIHMAATQIAAKATVAILKHNDMDKPESHLAKYSSSADVNNIWYFGDGIYSMSGAKAPVTKIVELLNKYPKFYCYLDDAHGMSAYGKRGQGYVLSQMERMHERIVVAVSLSKAFGMGCGGAIVFPNDEWRRKVQSCGPTMIFSSPIPPPMLGGGIESAKIHLSREMETMQEELADLMQHFTTRALEAGLNVAGGDTSPIQFVQIGELESTLRTIRQVFDDGYFVNTCAFPAVPKNRCGLRVTITRHTSKENIDGLIQSIRSAVEKHAPNAILSALPA